MLVLAAFAFMTTMYYTLTHFTVQTAAGIFGVINVIVALTRWFVIPMGREQFNTLRQSRPVIFALMIAAVATFDSMLIVFGLKGLEVMKEFVSTVAFFGGPLLVMYLAPELYKGIQKIRATAN